MQLTRDGGSVSFTSARYQWSWSAETDVAELRDPMGRAILNYPLQPAIEISEAAEPRPGDVADVAIEGDALRVRYERVHGDGSLTVALRFRDSHYMLEETMYEPGRDVRIRRMAYLGGWKGGDLVAAGVADTCVVPGGRQDPETAIFRTAALDGVTFNVGCFGGGATYHQQWALPHYLVCCYNDENAATLPPAVCVGLGGVPDGAAQVRVGGGRLCYELMVHGELWDYRRGPGPHRFDTPLVFATGDDWYDAGRRYFAALESEGYAKMRASRGVPASALLPQYDTWGDQGARRAFLERFDETSLREIYADFRSSGLRSGLFVIDDKWEELYGSLEHDVARFPRFGELLDEIRSDGYGIGLWTAFPRCEDFRALGLTEADVLMCPDGSPYVHRDRKRSWYVFDPTSRRAAQHLAERARHLVRTYRPALVKIDFGYEIPRPDVAGPHDAMQGGERLFQRFIEIVVGALKEADPELAVLYYCLTPLFGGYLDLCAADDLWMSRGAYDRGFAKRALLSTWCGSSGVVAYGSSGYDWKSAEEIWLDSAIIGTAGVIAPLAGDEFGARLTPSLAARYNGIARVMRRNTRYEVALYDADLRDPETGPVARSWGRVEDGRTVAVVARPGGGDAAVTPVVRSACRVAVASLTDDDIATSAAIAVVPFGDGAVEVRRTMTAAPRVRAHLLDGREVPAEWEAIEGAVRVRARTAADDGTPVEWIEVAFA
jgi:hypothetical protein